MCYNEKVDVFAIRERTTRLEGSSLELANHIPYPYRQMITGRLSPALSAEHDPVYRGENSLGVFVNTDDEEMILDHIDQITRANEAFDLGESILPPTYGAVARVEFFCGKERRTKGANLFDNRGNLILHAVSATLGYEGTGPALSLAILSAIGVSDELFASINSACRRQEYDVIFSRETTYFDSDVEYVVSHAPVRPEWSAYIV